MGRYAVIPEVTFSEASSEQTTKLGEALSGRFADVAIDSAEAVREQREP